jgi:hypothetical protein
MTIKNYLLLLLLIFSRLSFSQSSKDTLFLVDAKKNAINNYQRVIQGQAKLYNGSEYVKPEQTGDSHPFYVSDDWSFGFVNYDGERFENVPLLYDITSDKLVTENYYNASEMELVYDKLTGFSLVNHIFEKITNQAVNNSLPQSGFYEVLYNGTTKTIARHQKKPQETIVSNQIEIDFEEKDHYFILKNGSYYPVKSKGSVLKLLADEKTALKQFLNKNSINFKLDREKALVRLAEHYDTLKTK